MEPRPGRGTSPVRRPVRRSWTVISADGVAGPGAEQDGSASSLPRGSRSRRARPRPSPRARGSLPRLVRRVLGLVTAIRAHAARSRSVKIVAAPVPPDVQGGLCVEALLPPPRTRGCLCRRGGRSAMSMVVAWRGAAETPMVSQRPSIDDRDPVVVVGSPAPARRSRRRRPGRRRAGAATPGGGTAARQPAAAPAGAGVRSRRPWRRQPGDGGVARAVDGPVDELAARDVHDPQHRLLGAAFGELVGQQVALLRGLPAVERRGAGRVDRHRVEQHPLGAVGSTVSSTACSCSRAPHEEAALPTPGR
jgi:hypothetical protein